MTDKDTVDLNKVQAVIDDESITYGEIVNFTGMSKGAIRPYRTGDRSITKMQIENALKFQELYDQIKKRVAD